MKLTIPGVDFSWGTVNARALKAAGMKFGISYLSIPSSQGKNLSKQELEALWSAGLFGGVVWETTAGRMLGGYSAGVADATEAKKQADALRPGMPVAFAADFDITPAQKAAALRYVQGAASVLGKRRVGVYCDYWLVKHLVENGDPCAFYWQTYAWSGGLVHPRACVLQYSNGHTISGLSVDFDHADPSAFTTFLVGPTSPPAPSRHASKRQLQVWRHHLHEIQDVARICGWTTALRAAAARLRNLIKTRS